MVTSFSNLEEKNNNDVTKAKIKWIKKEEVGEAIDFNKNLKQIGENNVYHHVGIYAFKPDALKKFVNLKPSINENKLKLEQMRALDNNMTIGVSYDQNIPISVDTKEDLMHVERLINKND